jgi:hypothetical protein
MSASVKGTAHYFGLGVATLTNATIISINAAHDFQLKETTEDENGVTIETRKDNRLKTLSVTIRIKDGYTFPAIGDVIAIANLKNTAFNGNYELDSTGETYSNNGYLEKTLELVQYEGITYTLPGG